MTHFTEKLKLSFLVCVLYQCNLGLVHFVAQCKKKLNYEAQNFGYIIFMFFFGKIKNIKNQIIIS